MTWENFVSSLASEQCPDQLSVYLRSLWLDAKGKWQQAHELIQDLPDHHAANIHAYLHRKEGDQFNADYWYRKANSKRFSGSLEAEWEQLVHSLLQ